jgi:hypothetical protein
MLPGARLRSCGSAKKPAKSLSSMNAAFRPSIRFSSSLSKIGRRSAWFSSTFRARVFPGGGNGIRICRTRTTSSPRCRFLPGTAPRHSGTQPAAAVDQLLEGTDRARRTGPAGPRGAAVRAERLRQVVVDESRDPAASSTVRDRRLFRGDAGRHRVATAFRLEGGLAQGGSTDPG